MMERAQANLAFLRSREKAIGLMKSAELEAAVRESLPSLSSPPTPEEAASLALSLGADDFPALCLALSGAVGTESKEELFSLSEGEGGSGPARIAYLQNAFSDRAYRRFASAFSTVAAVYFPGFREVAEEVYSGRATHAILPTASSADGQILSFRRLIGRYDLKITAVCDIPTGDEQTMRFALLRRGLPSPPPRAACLDLSAVPTDALPAGELISVCERMGASLLSVNSHPSDSEEGRNSLDLILDMQNADPFALYLYLEGSHALYVTVGSYDVL